MTILSIIFVLLFVAYALLILIYLYGWYQQKPSNLPIEFIPTTKISVIIPARNEESNIEKCLQSVLNNYYPKDLLEVIVIDDFSTDKTAVLAKELLGNQGRVLALKDYLTGDDKINAYKKKSLEIAINEASGDLIVSTDADCFCTPDWLNSLASVAAQKKIQFIAAPVSFCRKSESALLYYFQSLDFMTMQGITAASTYLKLGNMCNGANLAFQKSTFEKVGGYKNIDEIASGDDMLLMYKINRQFPNQVVYLKSKQAIVQTEVQGSWHNFLNQRIRWSSKNDKYQEKKLIFILALVYFFNVSLVIQFLLGFFNLYYFKLLVVLLLGKIIIELVFLLPVASFFSKQKELAYFPFLQPFHILYIVIAGFLGKFGSFQWKGRKVH